MSSSNQDSNPESRTLPQYSETASLAPSYKTNDSSKELSQKDKLAMLEQFRKEQESSKDFEDWHLGANAPGTKVGGESGVSKAIDSKLRHVGHMMGDSKSKGEDKLKHQQ
jgi:hypothetical protein